MATPRQKQIPSNKKTTQQATVLKVQPAKAHNRNVPRNKTKGKSNERNKHSWVRSAVRSMNTLIKRTILLMIAVFVFGCANHREARRKSVRLYPGLPQREVVGLFGMPNKAEGNPDEGNPSGDYDEHHQGSGDKVDFQHRTEDELVWEYDDIDLKITFRQAQAGWVVKTWSID
jgi:hypothetical protein